MVISSKELTAQAERYSDVEPELKAVYAQHWDEVALNKDVIPLDPNYEAYRTLDRAGSVLLVTLRHGDKLAGYFIGFLFPNMHYMSSYECFGDIFRVLPEYRQSWAGVKLFRAVHAELKTRQVKRWHVTSKDHKDSGALMRRLGFTAVETNYSRLV